MSNDANSPFHPDNLRIDTGEMRAVTPKKIRKRREHFVQVPMKWYEHLKGADGQTYRVALFLLYLYWKNNGDPIKLANGMLKIDGVSPQSKRRALRDLERRSLITVEWRPKKSPIVRLLVM
jgi:hypothetical protein